MNPLVTKRCSPVEEAIYQDGFQAGAASRVAEIDELKNNVTICIVRIGELRQQLEIERMRLVACGVVANANTPESAANAREMAPQYRSDSCDDVARAVDREMGLRQQLAALTMQCEKLVKWKHLMSYNDSFFGEHAGDLKRVVYEIDRSMPIRGDK